MRGTTATRDRARVSRGRALTLGLALVGSALLAWWQLRPAPRAVERAPDTRAEAPPRSTHRRSTAARSAELREVIRKASTAALPQGGEPSAGETIVEAGWGGRPGQFGRTVAHESNPEGPMSLAVDSRGNVVVLDQLNGRLQRFGPHGKLLSTHPIDSSIAQDIAVDGQGRTLVLTRLKQPAVDIYGRDGERLAKVPLPRDAVGDGAALSAVLSDENGTYVELDNYRVQRIADSAGKPAGKGETVPGRPTRDGELFIRAGIDDGPRGKLYVQAHHADRSLAWETPLRMPLPLLHILLLDSDTKGRIYLGAEIGAEDEASGSTEMLQTIVVRLDSRGKLTGQVRLPATTADPSESLRPLAIGDDGTIFHMVPSAAGLTITRYRIP